MNSATPVTKKIENFIIDHLEEHPERSSPDTFVQQEPLCLFGLDQGKIRKLFAKLSDITERMTAKINVGYDSCKNDQEIVNFLEAIAMSRRELQVVTNAYPNSLHYFNFAFANWEDDYMQKVFFRTSCGPAVGKYLPIDTDVPEPPNPQTGTLGISASGCSYGGSL
jgi:hypothetical protein